MKKKLQPALAAILMCFGSISEIDAQWITNGPYGGAIYAVETAGTNVYAGTGGNGVFRSADNGATWTAANNGLERIWINTLAYDGSRIYAGSSYNGVYVSSDNGSSWTNKSAGLTNNHIETLFSTTAGMYAGTSDGVFRTNNGGNAWTYAGTGLPATYNVYSWAQMGDTIYAGLYGTGLYMSTTSNTSWTQVSAGFPTSNTGVYVYSLGSEGNNLYAGTNLGIYRSTNRGMSWAPSSSGMPTESGAFVTSFTFKPGYIFAGTHGSGIYVSTDGGASWTVKRTGLEDWPSPMGIDYSYQRINDMAVSGNNVLAASFDAMYKSSDNGNTWAPSQQGILATNLKAIAASTVAVFAAEHNTGMYVSANTGDSWVRANNGLLAGAMLAATTKGDVAFVTGENKQVYRSIDNGGSWQMANNGLTATVDLIESNGIKVYAVTRGGMGYNQKLFETNDNGNTWVEITGANAISGGMSALALRDNFIYVGTYNGMLLRSDDNGASWMDIGSYLPTTQITAIISDSEATYVGTNGKGIYRIPGDNYAAMTSANAGLSNFSITDFTMANDLIFASTWGGGVFASSNGTRWFATEGPANPYVSALATDKTRVYAATNTGVYQTDENSFARFTLLSDIRQNQKDIVRLYPNPVKDQLYYDVERRSDISISDITGKQVYIYENAPAEGSIDLAGLLKGMYFVRFSNADGATVSKIIVE